MRELVGYLVGHIVFRFVAFWPGLIWHGRAAAMGIASWWLMLGGTVVLVTANQRRRHIRQVKGAKSAGAVSRRG